MDIRIIRLLQVGFLLALVPSSGCHSRFPAATAPTMENLSEVFGGDPSREKPESPERPAMQIYIDASQSMQGFLTLSQGRFRRSLDQLLDQSVSGGYDVSVFKFDDEVIPLPASTSVRTLRSSGFFTGAETSFPALFRDIRKRRKPGSIAVVITDLVQSGRTGEQRELSRAFQELAGDHPEVLLLAQRAPFVGTYWPEATEATDRVSLDLRGTDTQSSRPFYLLAIADRVEEIKVLRRRLDLRTPDDSTAWAIDASRPAIEVKEVSFAPPSHGRDSRVWQILRPPTSLASTGRSPRHAFWLSERRSPTEDGTPIRLRLQFEDELGVESLDDLTSEVHRCRFMQNSECQAVEAISVPTRVRLEKANELSVAYWFPRPRPGEWDAYQVRLLPGQANLRGPSRVDLWTTNDDTRASHGTRTYKLDLFVDTLTTTLREPVAICEQFIVLGRE